MNPYFVWPGYACVDDAEMLTIAELREKAKKQLDSKFDIKEFHRVLLENGTMPLELAEKQVEEYIEKNK